MEQTPKSQTKLEQQGFQTLMLNLDELDTQADLLEQGVESGVMKKDWHISFNRSLKRIINECRTTLIEHDKS